MTETPPVKEHAALPDKFNKVEDLAKAYNASGAEALKVRTELNALQEKWKAPEKYEGVDEKSVGFEPSPMVLAVMKDNNIPLETAKAILKGVGDHLLPDVRKAATQLEIKAIAADWKLDPASAQFKEKFDSLLAWSKQANPAEMHDALSGTAKGIMAMDRLRIAEMTNQRTANFNSQGAGTVTKADIQKMATDPKMYRDPEYTNKVIKIVEANPNAS